MKLLLKRDDITINHPTPDQLDVGELVMNSVTGKLYTKLVDGSVIEFIGQRICFDPKPIIKIFLDNQLVTNDNIDDFCPLGDMLSFEVEDLKLPPFEYFFEFKEITNNTIVNDIEQVEPVKYTEYTHSIVPDQSTDTNDPNEENTNNQNVSQQTITLRKATILIKLSISQGAGRISLFKFIVKDRIGQIIREQLLSIRCPKND
jgi:hypothetical protein